MISLSLFRFEQRKYVASQKGFSRHIMASLSPRGISFWSHHHHSFAGSCSLLLFSRAPNNLNRGRSYGHWDFDLLFYIFEPCSLSSFHSPPEIVMHSIDTLLALATNGKLFDTDGRGETTIEIPPGPLLNQIDASLRSAKLTGTD
jgi:hypothetical protein